jgi:hypothetical protein
MKTRFFIILSFLSIVFTACNLTNESNYTPYMSFYKSPIVNGTDTLGIYYTDESNVYRLDTITVGDTVSFQMYYNSYSNNLLSVYLTQSADSVSRIILPRKTVLDSIFLSTSDYSKGKFLMGGTSSSLYFPFKYVAEKASLEAGLTLSVVSDANFKDASGSNSVSIVLKTPIVAKK